VAYAVRPQIESDRQKGRPMAYKFRLNLENGLDIGDLTLAWGIGDEFWNRDHHQFRVTDLVAGEDLDRDQYCGAGVVAPLALADPKPRSAARSRRRGSCRSRARQGSRFRTVRRLGERSPRRRQRSAAPRSAARGLRHLIRRPSGTDTRANNAAAADRVSVRSRGALSASTGCSRGQLHPCAGPHVRSEASRAFLCAR